MFTFAAATRKLRLAVAGAVLTGLGLCLAPSAMAFTDANSLDMINEAPNAPTVGLSGLKIEQLNTRPAAARKKCSEQFDGAERVCNGMRALDALMPSDRKTSPRPTESQPDQRLP